MLFERDRSTTEVSTLSLHDALPIFQDDSLGAKYTWEKVPAELEAKCLEMREKLIEACADLDEVIMEKFLDGKADRSEEHTSELQSQFHLVCRLLLEKKRDTTLTVAD